MASASTSNNDRMARLAELRMKRNEARKQNHQEVVEEDRRKKMPANMETRVKQAEWEAEQDRLKRQCAEQGQDYDRVRLLDVTAESADKWDQRRKRRLNADPGFSSFEDATRRQYERLTKQLKPNFNAYEREKERLGEGTFFPDSEAPRLTDRKDTREAVDRLVADLDKQQARKAKFSRRRAFDPDADVDYINERNKRFNKKLERFYGPYTAEIRQNLERGTAV